MRVPFLLMLFLLIEIFGFAQKQSFDVVKYEMPKGWDKMVTENGVQLSTKDDGEGSYAVAVIIRAIASTGTPDENFSSSWEKLVKGTVKVSEAPDRSDMNIEKGWICISGQANYTDGNTKGTVNLVTATGNSKMVNIVLMTNTNKYHTELLSFLNSLELPPATVDPGNNKIIVNNNNNSSLAGLWTNYILEKNGYSNGSPQYTGGYLRSEYLLKEDGTYTYRAKNWLVYGSKDIVYVYETGSYSVNGNQITLIPKQGKGGWWKKTKNTKEWGPLVKDLTGYKPEKKTYNFEIKDLSGSDNTTLILKTENKTGLQESSYTKRALNESLIDTPPGFTTGFENSSPVVATKKDAAVTIHSPLSGKIWQGTTTEKFSNAGGTSYNTGGFATSQYQFNTDGSYRFVSVTASHFTDSKSLQYETGTYTISGNQLTVTPAKGYNEEWSKIGKTSNGNGEVSNRVINETWGKKLKANSRKLETVTYTFSVGKNGDRNALILQYSNGHTEREGNGKQTYLTETAPENAAKLPAGMKW